MLESFSGTSRRWVSCHSLIIEIPHFNRAIIAQKNSFLLDSFLLFLEATQKKCFHAHRDSYSDTGSTTREMKIAEKPPTQDISIGNTRSTRRFQQRQSIDLRLRRVANEVRRERRNPWAKSNYPTISSRRDLCLPPFTHLLGKVVNRIKVASNPENSFTMRQTTTTGCRQNR